MGYLPKWFIARAAVSPPEEERFFSFRPGGPAPRAPSTTISTHRVSGAADRVRNGVARLRRAAPRGPIEPSVTDDAGPAVRVETPRYRSGARRRAAVLFLAVVSTTALPFAPALAQRPAELVGRVTDSAGAAVEGARLELVEAGALAVSDASGGYRFRAVSAGRYTLSVARIGHRERVVEVELEPGRTRRLDIRLVPAPIALEGVDVVVSPAESEAASAVRLDRAAIERRGARSAGDVVGAVPGVVVRSPAPGGPQTVSIRGSGADAVLVLVDGVVVNDPVTGEADLSTIPASSIESVTVLSGARSARYGPRAEAGVIVIETRGEAAERVLRASLGSLAARSAALVWGGRAPLDWGAGVDWSRIGGAFDYRLPPEAGGGERGRENADARTLDAWLGGSTRVAGGALRVRGAAASARRGLPGPGYAPSRGARQAVERLQGSASWRRIRATSALHVSLAGARHEVRFRDPAPTLGLAYDDTASVLTADLRAAAERRPAGGTGVGLGAGLAARWQRIATGQLAAGAPRGRLDAGIFADASGTARGGAGVLALAVELRADRDPASDAWWLNRSLTLSLARGGVRAHVASRSSYSPPTLGDQFFRAAVGVEPNPGLRAERVPSEIEAGLRAEHDFAGLHGSLGVTLYRGDVRDMIVWAPDYRFIWSPRNVDVKRRGAETTAEVEALGGRLHLGAAHAYARVTYDRAGPADTVQVIYRPRHTASLTAAWQHTGWRLDVDARYTGTRYPVPAPINALPAFWTVSAGVSAQARLGRWLLSPSLRADRLLDQDASLIFGFPDPGRVLRLDIALRPTNVNSPD